jgi:hypothetical protein
MPPSVNRASARFERARAVRSIGGFALTSGQTIVPLPRCTTVTGSCPKPTCCRNTAPRCLRSVRAHDQEIVDERPYTAPSISRNGAPDIGPPLRRDQDLASATVAFRFGHRRGQVRSGPSVAVVYRLINRPQRKRTRWGVYVFSATHLKFARAHGNRRQLGGINPG